MKPARILLFLLSVFSILTVIMAFFPKDGIKISENLTIQFITLEEFFTFKEKKDISDIIDNKVDDDTLAFQQTELLDSAMIEGEMIYFNPKPINIDSIRQYLEFPEGNKTILNDIFAILSNIRNTNDLIHILHYGDSQIEVDRMTNYIRYKMQADFGGTGPGFVPPIQVYDFPQPMMTSCSDNWFRYKTFPKKDTLVNHKRFGIIGNFFMFTEFQRIDTSKINQKKSLLDDNIFDESRLNKQYAWLNFEHSSASYSNVKIINQIKMYYGYNSEKFNLKLTNGSTVISDEEIEATDKLTVKTWTLNQSPTNLKFEFTGLQSPEIYGFTFDGFRGVQVDNIPIRGCSGDIFTKLDFNLINQMYSLMNVKLIIYQFGGNLVPYDTEEIVGFTGLIKSQLNYIKKACPNVPIIVIGPGDMSEKDKDEYVTHHNFIKVRDAVRKAALESNCVFWDMFQAMGGENSMPSWVFAEPSLAEKDFIHFTPNGALIVSKMFYNALMFEYNKYLVSK